MKHFTKSDIKDLNKVKRLNIINSITGVKPGNLIGTINKEKTTNLAIFSSVVHLGSNPALLGFILRPQERVRKDTYNNILENGSYSINHLPETLTINGHYTSAKFHKDQSEFDYCKFTEWYADNFKAPFVKESNLNITLINKGGLLNFYTIVKTSDLASFLPSLNNVINLLNIIFSNQNE